MTKSELIDAIAGRGELTKARAELVVNCVFDAMTEALERGEGIEIEGLEASPFGPTSPTRDVTLARVRPFPFRPSDCRSSKSARN